MRDKVLGITISVVAIAMVVYQLISAHYYLTGPYQHQIIHLAFALSIVFLSVAKEAKKRWQLILAIVLALAPIFVSVFITLKLGELELLEGSFYPPAYVYYIGAILVILVLEGTRRSFGWALPIVIMLFLIYTLVAHLIPGHFHAAYVPPERLLSRVGIGALGLSGIFGTLLGISASVIFLFVIFGSLLGATGAVRFFTQLGRLMGKKLASGPAVVAVVTSALVGTITGSIAANIATTGSFTIPMMKKAGYRAEQAAAIEAVASTGGMIMPPIMGTMIFVMMAFTGVAYVQLMAMLAIPAILYFLSAGLYAQFQAMKLKISSLPVEEVDRRELLVTAPLFIVPLLFVIILLTKGFSLSFTVSLAIVLLVALSFIRKETRPSLKRLVDGFTEGTKVAAGIAASMGAVGIMLATLAMTGLVLKVPAFVEATSGGILIIALILTMFASIIIGMGSSTTAAYVLVALVTAPVLVNMGLNIVQAHLFAVYFALMGFLTPPVAIGAMIAARLAGSPYIKTAIEASKVAIAGFIIPYLFVWVPVLLLQPDDPLWAIAGLIASLVIIISLQIVICGHYLTTVTRQERVIFGIVALMIFLSLPGRIYVLLVPAIVIFILVTIRQWQKRKSATPALEAMAVINNR